MNSIQCDLHIHSIYSDGSLYPAEILDFAKTKGLKLISITDHDCLGAFTNNLQKEDIKVIPGIELKTIHQIFDKTIKGLEILGYGFSIEKLKKQIEPLRQRKINCAEQYLKNFTKLSAEELKSAIFKLNKPLEQKTLRDFFEFKANKVLTDEEYAHFLENSAPTALEIAKFICRTFFDAPYDPTSKYVRFKKEFSNIFTYPETDVKIPDLNEAIKIVKNANGIAILAHPAVPGVYNVISQEWLRPKEEWFKSKPEPGKISPFELIKTLKNNGLDGIEIYNYSGVMKFDEEIKIRINLYFKELAKKLDLITTWGSDCHGQQEWGLQIGTFGSSYEELGPFLSKCS